MKLVSLYHLLSSRLDSCTISLVVYSEYKVVQLCSTVFYINSLPSSPACKHRPSMSRDLVWKGARTGEVRSNSWKSQQGERLPAKEGGLVQFPRKLNHLHFPNVHLWPVSQCARKEMTVVSVLFFFLKIWG